MESIEYFRPSTLDEALYFLKENGDRSRIIAGGTDLMISLREEKLNCDFLVDITHLDELKGISVRDAYIDIGPLTTHSELSESEIIKRDAPILAKAALSVGGVQIRNIGTVGGNIVNGSPAADTLPPIVVLEGVLTVKSATKTEEIGIENFYEAPYKPIIKNDEILTNIRIKKIENGERFLFEKLARRVSLAISRMSLAIVLKANEEKMIEKIKIACGSVTPTPVRIRSVEDLLMGKIITEDLADKASILLGEEMVKTTGIRWSTAYKKPVIGNMLKRALFELIGF
ncbi:MAG: hypothetical protein DRP55_00275 [Spirochaetes bacterium]|nr:MAG: hypothetical protein DRP55_00275 [Spirochaetota bacterium]